MKFFVRRPRQSATTLTREAALRGAATRSVGSKSGWLSWSMSESESTVFRGTGWPRYKGPVLYPLESVVAGALRGTRFARREIRSAHVVARDMHEKIDP